jgi:hypothetical protein
MRRAAITASLHQMLADMERRKMAGGKTGGDG